MKRLFESLLAVSLMFITVVTVSAGSEGMIPSSKEARKIAKQWKKEGWMVKGEQPLENQLEYVWMKVSEFNEDGIPMCIHVTAEAKATTYDDARRCAMEIAKIRIASSLGTRIEALIESRIVNNQISLDENLSMNDFVSKSKSSVLQRIGRVTPAIECWREYEDEVVQVRVIVLYDVSQIEDLLEV